MPRSRAFWPAATNTSRSWMPTIFRIPTRLAVQREFLESHPKVGAVGTWVRLFDDRTGETVYSLNRAADSGIDPQADVFQRRPVARNRRCCASTRCARLASMTTTYAAAEDYELMRRIAHEIRPRQYSRMSAVVSHFAGRTIAQPPAPPALRPAAHAAEYFEPLEWRAWAGVDQDRAA